MRALTLLFCLLSVSTSAQEAITFRRAFLPVSAGTLPDTTGLRAATGPNGETVWIGEVLLEIRPGDVESVGLEPDAFSGQSVVAIAMAPEAAQAFADVTGANVGGLLAIMLGERLLSAPRINGHITGGRVTITGFSRDEAETLARSIRETTGAADPRTLFARTAQDFRAALDLSTPEAAAMTFAQAHEVGDPVSIASTLHPLALAEFRIAAEQDLRLVGDSVRWHGGTFEPDRGDTPLTASVRDILLDDPPEAAWGAYTDEQATALWLALLNAPLAAPPPYPSGAVMDGDGRAFVVMTPDANATPPFMSSARALEVRRVDGLWRVIPPTNWLRGE